MKKLISFLLTFVLIASVCGCSPLTASQLPDFDSSAASETTTQTPEASAVSSKTEKPSIAMDESTTESIETEGNTPVVAIAWTPSVPKRVVEAFEKAGAEIVILPQIKYDDFSYNDEGKLSDEYLAPSGMLQADAAESVKNNWQNSNAAEVLEEVTLVVFSGGSDISPSLYHVSETEQNAGEAFNATRDVSDYLLMRYCLDADIPVFGICRGMQLLAVASGASLIQDLPTYYAESGKEYHEYHRMNKGENRDYTAHDVNVTDSDSLLYSAIQTDVVSNAPSWHHQSVRSVDNTDLKITASSTIGGIEIIEGIERTDLSFAVGVQFHPETAIYKASKGSNRFTDSDSTIQFLKNILDLSETQKPHK